MAESGHGARHGSSARPPGTPFLMQGRMWRRLGMVLAVVAGVAGLATAVWQLPPAWYPHETGQPRATLQAGLLAVAAAAVEHEPQW